MPQEQNVEVIELSLEKTIETKLVQSNVTEAVLSALKEKYGSMKLKSVDDKESYLELKVAAKECAKVRTLTVKLCKEGRDEAVKTQKLWIAKEKEVVGKVSEVEDALDAEIKKFDDNVARLEQEEKERQESAYINRQATLTKMGAVYTDGCFILGEASFEANLVKGSSEEVWADAIVPKFTAEYEKIEAVRVAEEKRKEQEAEELRQKQAELEKQQREFQEKQAEFERQQQEATRKENERIAEQQKDEIARINELQKQRFQLLFPFNPTGADVDMNTLWSLTDVRFAEVLEGKKNEFEKAKAEQERLAEEKRLADIETAKQDAIKKEQERQAEEKRLAELKTQEAEAKRLADLEAAGDKTKWDEFINQLKAVEMFDMRSGQYRKKMQMAKEKIEEILNF